MRALGLLTALAIAAAGPAMAMNEESHPAQQCVRRIDAFGNVRVICPDVNAARAAWIARQQNYRGNYVVYYQNGPTTKEWRKMMKKGGDHDKR